MPRLTDYSVWVFECEGTLIDGRGGFGRTRPSGRSSLTWPVFPDAATALLYLRTYVRLVAATGVEPGLLAACGERLGVPFDAVVSLEGDGEARSDRDRAEPMRSALSALGVEGRDILYVAGAPSPASGIVRGLGGARCRIDRGAGPPPSTAGEACEFHFANLAELVIAHQAAVRAP